ncbi:helix-turn-helix transcriptional regulator [Mesorhizobium sp. M1B.F.Ca.ET.045.04.1.1]|uniref:helix-turn-helix transcriptional regulator n=1 Tax=Mesorhizobium sp. M1B.F.Ca.ET.045.04.1.1 TaxID=2493673 RepID=UPI000F74DBBE|nr:helix-turn-helix transcriptional regulator [Mesorhizobium sp. M1B.F.Ca.ET.045.04.1.1]AZO32416.1 helix-turn-helix transcriptional regulator [Mesorhizobium sp. M1B.F.Ca.ET.045.04.1.1]
MLHNEQEEAIIDRLYEAAAIPEKWGGRGVLDALANLCGCTDSAIMSVRDHTLAGWTANEIAFPKLVVYVRDNWLGQNPYVLSAERLRRFSQPRFVMDTEVMSAEEMQESYYYQKFMHPYGMYWHAGTNIMSPNGDTVKLSVHRSYEAGPLDAALIARLNSLRPHIARACVLTARLRFAQLHAAVEVLNSVGLPAAALRDGRLALANNLFEKLMPDVAQDRRSRLAFMQTAADKRWASILMKPINLRNGTFPLASTEERPMMVVHVLPVAGAGKDIFPVADSLMILASSETCHKIAPEILLSLFDFTPAEISITNSILSGASLEEIARARRVSVETVRVQLKAIFAKTGTHRQTELVKLLGGVASASNIVDRVPSEGRRSP